MNLATPVIICHENDDFRSLLRDMLTKHGFFHVLEATSSEEALSKAKSERDNYLLLIHSKLVAPEIVTLLATLKNFIILAQPDEKNTLLLTARFGVKHFLSFPFSSQLLFERIQQF